MSELPSPSGADLAPVAKPTQVSPEQAEKTLKLAEELDRKSARDQTELYMGSLIRGIRRNSSNSVIDTEEKKGVLENGLKYNGGGQTPEVEAQLWDLLDTAELIKDDVSVDGSRKGVTRYLQIQTADGSKGFDEMSSEERAEARRSGARLSFSFPESHAGAFTIAQQIKTIEDQIKAMELQNRPDLKVELESLLQIAKSSQEATGDGAVLLKLFALRKLQAHRFANASLAIEQLGNEEHGAVRRVSEKVRGSNIANAERAAQFVEDGDLEALVSNGFFNQPEIQKIFFGRELSDEERKKMLAIPGLGKLELLARIAWVVTSVFTEHASITPPQ